MTLKADRIRKALTKRTKKGFRGYPIGTIAYYGPNNKIATKVVASIIAAEEAEADPMEKWFSDIDLRRDDLIFEKIRQFLTENEDRPVVMLDRIIGCPHEEGIDYPEGEECNVCPFWKGRDRWTGEKLQ